MYSLIVSSFGHETIIKDNGDGSSTSFGIDEANTDYQAYLAWLSDGNMPNPYVPPAPPIPLTPAEKLEAAGLSVDDLKTLLGIK